MSEKGGYYKNKKVYRDHERELALIKAFTVDPELKYFVGMAAGAGVAWVGTMLGDMGHATTPSGSTAVVPQDDPRRQIPYFWLLSGGLGGIAGLGAIESLAWGSGGAGGGLTGNIGNVLALGGTGFAGTCAMILILKSIFSGTDLGELLSGVGEIVPL